MALITVRVVTQTDPKLIELARDILAGVERIAEATERQADALEAVVEALQAPPEQIPTSIRFTAGTPQEE